MSDLEAISIAIDDVRERLHIAEKRLHHQEGQLLEIAEDSACLYVHIKNEVNKLRSEVESLREKEAELWDEYHMIEETIDLPIDEGCDW